MPSLESLHQRYKGEPFALVAINIQESKKTLQRSVEQHGISFTNLMDSTGEVSALYGVQSTPVKFLIGPDGNMVGAAMGYREWDNKDMHSLIDLLIKQVK